MKKILATLVALLTLAIPVFAQTKRVRPIGSRPARYVSRTAAKQSAKKRHQRYIYKRNQKAYRQAQAKNGPLRVLGPRRARFVSPTQARQNAKLRHQRYIYKRDQKARRQAAYRRRAHPRHK